MSKSKGAKRRDERVSSAFMCANLARRGAWLAASAAGLFLVATPALADPILTPLITAALESTLGSAVAGFSIFGVTLGSVLAGVITTPIGRGLVKGRRT